MKKYFYLFLSLFTVILVSCNQNNPSDPTNPSNPGDPSNPSNPGDPSNPSDVNKVKYIKESASWYTYQNTENGTNWSEGLNVVTKSIYERASEAKYIKSQSIYKNGKLVTRRTYQNESDRDYSWTSYPSGSETSSRDTTIWYDDARTKQKETRNSTYYCIYEYDSQHHDRQVSVKVYYQSGYMREESHYTYNGLTRHGETKFYNSDGKMASYQSSTTEFLDDSFTHQKSRDGETFTYNSESQRYLSSTSKTRFEWNGMLCAKIITDSESYDQSGKSVMTTRSVQSYIWQDELNYTEETESYLNGSLMYRISAYVKYTY